MENITREELNRMMEIVNAWKAEAQDKFNSFHTEGKFHLANDAWAAVDHLIWMRHYLNIAQSKLEE